MEGEQSGDDLVAEALRRSEEWQRLDEGARTQAISGLRRDVDRASAAGNPALVDGTDLTQWADRTDSGGKLPELIRRLVALAPGVSRLSGRAGDGVALPGWDLIAEAEPGDQFVPSGWSTWEFSTSARPQQKAAADLAKRSADPLGVTPDETSLILVTLRRWSGKDEWAMARASAGPWRDVRVYDADDLEAWLQIRPSVHYWLSALLGRRPDAAQTIEQWWHRWAQATTPPISGRILSAGRGEQTHQLNEWLASDSPVTSVRADTTEEGVAFVAATLLGNGETPNRAQTDRAIVVSDPTAWSQISAPGAPLLLIPLTPELDVHQAIENGHRVLLPVGPDASLRGQPISLRRLDRNEVQEALADAGIPEQRSRELALLARRSLMAFRRRLGVSQVLRRPPWAEPPSGSRLAPLLLLGRWVQGKEGDHDAVATITGRSYPEVERDLAVWSASEDPPVRRVGATWTACSKDDLWLLLGPLLSAGEIGSFRTIFSEVLQEPDPALELDSERRHMAAIFGLERRWSADLREGLADTCAFLGSRGEGQLPDGSTPQAVASLLVDNLLSWADADTAGERWASLSLLLPLLAESSPDQFLRHVEGGLVGDTPLLANIFRDTPGSASLFGDSSPHTGLLWALEGLCWEPEYLGRAALALAALADIDPGGRLSNRPDASLQTIFLIYQPHTRAGLDLRLEVLDSIRDRHPVVGWKLLRALLPNPHAWWTSTHSPRWRDWRPDDVPMSTVGELVQTCEDLISRLVVDATGSGSRWAELVDALGGLPEPSRDRLIGVIGDVLPGQMIPAEQELVWTAIDEFLVKHRRFPDADWSLPEAELLALEQAQRSLHAAPASGSAVTVFSYRPRLPGVEEFGPGYDNAIRTARIEAARIAFQRGGLEEVLVVARQADVPEFAGAALAEIPDHGDDEAILALLGGIDADAHFAHGFVATRVQAEGWEWARSKIADRQDEWNPKVLVGILLAANVTDEVLEAVESLGKEVEARYWRSMSAFRTPPGLVDRVVSELVTHARPWSAIHLLAFRAMRAEENESLDVNTIAAALEAGISSPSDEEPDASGLPHDVAILLDRLEAAQDERAGRLEFAFLRLLEHQRAPRALQRQLASDPEFFVDVVCRVYRADGAEQEAETSEDDRLMAELAYTLLRSWHALPGQDDDGLIDGGQLKAWFGESRRLLFERKRGHIADDALGEVLSASPNGEDGVWPSEAVRDVIEATRSDELDRAIQIGRTNRRGVTTRNPADGGRQERMLATAYRGWATDISARWSRTSGVLRGLADAYEQEARWHDESAERWMDHD